MNTRPNFGSERQLIAWQRQCNELVATMKTDHAVAPECSVTRADGRVLGAGEPITVDDFEVIVTPNERISPLVQLERAVRNGAVLARGRLYPMQER